MSEPVKNLRFWPDGARRLGECPEHKCGGSLMVVEDMGEWVWAQCSRCHVQTGVRAAAAPAKAGGTVDAGRGEGWAF